MYLVTFQTKFSQKLRVQRDFIVFEFCFISSRIICLTSLVLYLLISPISKFTILDHNNNNNNYYYLFNYIIIILSSLYFLLLFIISLN